MQQCDGCPIHAQHNINMSTSLFFLSLLLVFSPLAYGGKKYGWDDGPFVGIPTLNVTSKSRPFVNNWCTARASVLDGSVAFSNALIDRTIYLGFNPKLMGGWNLTTFEDELWWRSKTDPKLGPISGTMVELWNELATRLRFKVQWVYVPYQGSTSTSTFVKYFGTVTDGWGTGFVSDAGNRRASNIDLTADNFLSQTVSLYGKQTITRAPKTWQFLTPFSPELWLILFFLMLFNAIALWWFNPPESQDSFIFSFIKSFNAFGGDKVDDADNGASMVVSVVRILRLVPHL